MPRGQIDANMFAPCGMNCMFCYKHCYHKKPCIGCLKDDTGKAKHCRECKIKDCVLKKGISYCYVCNEFPCKRIKNLEKTYRRKYGVSLIQHSQFVKENGLEIFMNSQKEKYTCPHCGGIISIHGSECSECQKQAYV